MGRRMHYIRFLKVPKLQPRDPSKARAAAPTVSAVITVTTDLGDDFLAEDVELDVSVLRLDGHAQLSGGRVQWRAGMRAVPVSVDLKGAERWEACAMRVVARGTDVVQSVELVGDSLFAMPAIYGVDSDRIALSGTVAQAERRLLRKVGGGGEKCVAVWEEAGESIARHVWDAGVTLASLLLMPGELSSTWCSDETVAQLLHSKRTAPIHIIELGCGSGVVGLALARKLQDCHVVLTDLAEHEKYVRGNIATNEYAPGSQAEFVALDWDDESPHDHSSRAFNLVVAADVTYNPDSSPALVRRMKELVLASQEAVVLLAMKTRHRSEDVFFRRMEDACFSIHSKLQVLAPTGASRSNVDGAMAIDVYTFKHGRH